MTSTHARLRDEGGGEPPVMEGADGERLPAEIVLRRAACTGDLERMRAALAQGADVNWSDMRRAPTSTDESSPVTGDTALHIAAQYGHMDAAVLLCQAGADVEARSRIGSTALHRAASEGHANVVAFLAEQMGASVHAVNKIGNTALHAAVCARQPAAAAELIRAMRGDGIHARNNIGMRAVDYADGCRDLQTLFDGP